MTHVRHIDRQRSPAFALTLTLIAAFSIAGLIYCLLAISGLQACPLAQCTLVLYGAYFAINLLCVAALFRWKRWGAYGLGAATFSLAVIGLLQGMFTLQEGTIGLILIAFGIAALQTVWPALE